MSEETIDNHEAKAAGEPIAVAKAPEPPVVRRQSLSLRSGVCDMRVGPGALDVLGQALKTLVGKPKRALVVRGADATDELLELVRRQLVDAEFDVRLYGEALPAGAASRQLARAHELLSACAAEGLTADDALVVVGDADLISLGVYVASVWQAGCALCAVPTTLDGMADVTVVPRALDLGDASEAVQARGNVRLAICDPGAIDVTRACEGTARGRVQLVAGAVTAGERSFSDLALHADDLLEGNAKGIVEAIVDQTKARCRVVSSSAIAIRQGAAYGLDVMRALRACLPAELVAEVGEARLMAEGLRIEARLAAAHQGPDSGLVDFVFAQDALLDKLGLAEVPCDLDATTFVEALKAAELSRHNRFMVPMPLDYGRVRLMPVEDADLAAHLGAWCKTRKKLKRKLEATA